MLILNLGVLDHMIRERQRGLRGTEARRSARPGARGLRLRLGHALIAAGSALSGEREAERPTRTPVLPRTA